MKAKEVGGGKSSALTGFAAPAALPIAFGAVLLATIALVSAPELLEPVRWFAGKAIARVGENIVALLLLPVDHTERFFLLYVLLSLGLAALVLRREGGSGSQGTMFARLFPSDIYWHASARLDYGLVALNRIFSPAVLLTRLVSMAALSTAITVSLNDWLGPRQPLLSGVAAMILFTILFSLTVDFADYLQHRLHHRIPLLWEFHRLHHSAEVLTPITALRNHPVEQVVGTFVSIPLMGLVTGLAGYWLIDSPQPITFFGAQLLISAFYCFCGVHLRHSHIWLSWSPALSHVLISPAQHQIHHSNAPQHYDRNFGNVLALWDWMFGSLYVPRCRETLTLGLPEGQPHATILSAYVSPVIGAARLLAGAPGVALGLRKPVAETKVPTSAGAAKT